jgi:outer membrane protein
MLLKKNGIYGLRIAVYEGFVKPIVYFLLMKIREAELYMIKLSFNFAGQKTKTLMKKLIFTLCVVLASAGAFAQIGQGTIMIGGSFGANFQTEKYKLSGNTQTVGKTTEITLTPQVGYFVIDNLAVGAGISLASYSFKPDGGGDKSTSTAFAFQPFGRYYFNNIFGELALGIGAGNSKTGGDIDSKFGLFTWSLGAGYAAFLNDHVAIEPKLGYMSVTQKDKDSDVKDINSGLFISVGIQVYLRK